MSDLRILTTGETDDVWLTTTANVDLSTAEVSVRTFPTSSDPTGSWVSPQDVEHPTANSLRTALRVTNATPGAYVMQAKITLGPLTIIESGYYWVADL